MQKLGIVEFSDVFNSNLDSLLITSESHILRNGNFYEEVIFKLFDIYQRDNSNYSINDLIKVFHIFLYSMFKHKPDTEKNEDIIILK